MQVTVRPLTAEAFKPYGDVLTAPSQAGRSYFDAALANLRADARPSLSLAHRGEVARLPLTARQMERHQFSSQSFVPVSAGRWLVLVAPHARRGGPDMAAAEAFLPAPGQGVTFNANVWHHPLTVLDRPGTFAILMWLVGGAGDEEFVDLDEPIIVHGG